MQRLFGLMAPRQAAKFLDARRKDLTDSSQGPLLEARGEETAECVTRCGDEVGLFSRRFKVDYMTYYYLCCRYLYDLCDLCASLSIFIPPK